MTTSDLTRTLDQIEEQAYRLRTLGQIAQHCVDCHGASKDPHDMAERVAFELTIRARNLTRLVGLAQKLARPTGRHRVADPITSTQRAVAGGTN
jgi:hypothetical protein